MSDNSHSTGSSGSSTNSWTLLSPEEATVESLGPVDDGTESLGDVPSLSEEVAGATAEIKPSEIAIETILSEEGHQVCQETSPEAGEGSTRSSPAPPNPVMISDADLESQPPIIHDIVTSSPSDNEHLGAIPFVTNLDLGEQVDIPIGEFSEPEFDLALSPPFHEIPKIPVSVEPVLDMLADIGPVSESPLVEEPVSAPEAAVDIPLESDPPPYVDISPFLESSETSTKAKVAAPKVAAPEISVQDSPTPESSEPETSEPEISTHVLPQPETVGATNATEESAMQMDERDLPEKVTQIEEEEAPEEPSRSFSFTKGDTSSDDDGLRRRHVQSFEAPRPRTSDEEDDEEEEVEFKLAEKKEEKQGLSLTKCIVGALILLCLGSLFLSDDSSELGDAEQNQNWPNPHDMKELLDKLTQENKQISQLEAQLQSQKVELDLALQAAAAKGDKKIIEDLEKENTKMTDELSYLPGLKEELETLRARVNEFTQLTANQDVPTTTPKSTSQPAETDQKAAAPERAKDPKDGGRLKGELHRQKVLLEESRKRLEKMKRDGGKKKGVRDGLEEIQKTLSEQVERLGKKKPWESKWNSNSGKDNQDQWKKQDKKEKRSEKDWKNNKDGGQQDKAERREKDWKSHKQNSHKEAWRKHQDEWDRKKDERRMDREQRKQEKPWHHLPNKDSHSHNHQHHQHQHQHHHQAHQYQEPHQYNHEDFWRHQEEKLRRSLRPQPGCSTVEDCASKEGLYPVEMSEFEELLEGYLSKLEGAPPATREAIRKLTAEFFEDGVFIHDRVRFSDFAEDVADILEDMADILEDMGQGDDDTLEEEMEEFEREALWKFSATA